MGETLTLLMWGSNHAMLLDEREELVIEDDVFVRDEWVKRVTSGWPTRDAAAPEEGC